MMAGRRKVGHAILAAIHLRFFVLDGRVPIALFCKRAAAVETKPILRLDKARQQTVFVSRRDGHLRGERSWLSMEICQGSVKFCLKTNDYGLMIL